MKKTKIRTTIITTTITIIITKIVNNKMELIFTQLKNLRKNSLCRSIFPRIKITRVSVLHRNSLSIYNVM